MRRKKRKLIWNPDPGVLCIVRVLVLLQAGFAFLSVFEAAVVGFSFGNLVALLPTIALTGGTALLVLFLVARLARRSYLARRLLLIGELVVVLGALVDLVLAVAIARQVLDPVPTLTRLVLPISVIVLLRRGRRHVAVEGATA